MSADQHPMIRELFGNMKKVVSERLDLIMEVINSIEKPKIPLYDNEFVKRIERLENQFRTTSTDERIAALEEQLASTCAELETMKYRLAESTKQPQPLPKEGLLEEDLPEEILHEEDLPEDLPEEEDEGGLELEEFPYKGIVYYKDANDNVYTTDDEGDVIPEPIARWNGTKLVRI